MGQLRGARLGAIPFRKLFKLRKWLPGILAAAAGLLGPVDYAFSQPATDAVPMLKPGMPGVVAPVAPGAPATPPEKTISVHFEKAEWAEVLDWYAKETGMTLITIVKPTGSLTLKPGKDRKFTMAEVTDLLNEALTQQKFILIRRHQTFFIHPADEKVDPTWIPRIELSELPKRGRSEIVQVIIPIKGMVVADVQEELKKLLTPFGTLIPLDKPNFLLVQDTVGNIKRILETLEAVEGDKIHSDSLDHVCKWCRAQVIAETLKTLLTDKDTTATITGAQAMQAYSDPRFGGGFDRFGPGGGFDRGRDFGRGPGGQQPTTNARIKTVQIAVDARRNAILVTAPQDKIVIAKQFIEKQDQKILPTDREIVPQEPVLKTYSVPTGTAAEVAKALQAKMPWVNVAALAAQNQIMVVATPDDQISIALVINGAGDGSAVTGTEFIPLTILDPAEAAATVVKLVQSSAAGGPTIEPVKSGNYGLIVKGTPAQVAEVKNILYAQGEPKPSGIPGMNTASPTTRTLSLGADTNALLIAEMLGRAMEDTRGKKVIIKDGLGTPKPPVIPPAPGTLPKPPVGLPPAVNPQTPPPPMRVPRTSLREPLPGRDNLYPVAAQIVDPDRKDDKPITIVVVGNKLIISSEDTQALDIMTQLYRILTSEGTKPNDTLMKVIPLKYIAAEDAAREISDIFNGPQQQQQGGQGRQGGFGFNPLALLGGLGGGGQQAAAADKGRVRVVAEKSSNSLIVVKASPLDYMLIEKLLSGVIDGGRNESAAVMKTFVLPLKNADATEMATLVRGVFKSYMASTGGNQAIGNFPFLPGLGGGQPQQQQQRPPALSVEIDDRSNSIVVLCAETLYEDIKKLVNELDEATVSTTEVTQLVKLRGVDPNVVQQAINALQGRDTRNMGGQGFGRGTGTGFGGQGGNNFGGQGFGGGNFGGLPGLGTGFGAQGFGGQGLRGGTGGQGNRGGQGQGQGQNRGGGRGGRISLGPTQEGPLNFDYRGKDAPSAAFKLYDPQTDVPDLGYNRPAPPNSPRPLNQIVQAGAMQPDVFPPGPPRKEPGPGEPVWPDMTAPRPPYGTPQQYAPVINRPAPRGVVSAIPVQGLDVVIVRAEDLADLKIVLDLIDMIAEYSKGTAPRVEVVYLQYGDCNYVATTLNSIFARVTIGQDGNYVPAQARTAQNALATQVAGASPTQNVYALALPRFNAILLAAPEGRFDDVVREMRRLLDDANRAKPKAFYLKKASAQLVASQLQNFWNSRFPGESLQQNQFRVTFDVANNILFVQASPADLADVEELLKHMDEAGNKSVNDMRIFQLRNALADELGQILSSAISSNVVSPIAQSQQTGPVAQQAGGAVLFNQVGVTPGLGLGQQGFGQQGQLGQQLGLGQQGLNQGALTQTTGAFSSTQFRPINAIIPTIGTGAGGGLVTKTKSIRFFSSRDGRMYETGYLEDVNIVSSARVNALIVSAPEATMKLIEKLIENLDTVAAARSYVNVFQLKRGMDATLTANLISQLFTSQGRTQTTGLTQPGGGLTGQQQTNRPFISLSPNPSDGASLIDLRISVDDRTNSLIVAGSRNDLDAIGAIVAKLETTDTNAGRYNEVIKLRNAAAADVATTVQTFFQNQLAVYTANYASAYQQLLRNVFVVAEPVSNTVLISATPEYFGEIKRIIDRIDSQPPQVLIQVTIAEVQLNNAEEFGVEVGLQSPVLFDRNPANTAGAGFNFNTPTPSTTLPAGQVGPGITGFQGLGNLGVGRVSATQGFAGFVFSASNDTFSLLIRALKAQGRVDVLSRPQIQVADSQIGYINVGQSFPTLTGSAVGVGIAQQGIAYRDIGITLQVTPRVNPDGKVLMRVEPSVSSVQPGTINLGNGVLAPIFNQQVVSTTVLASDGETIILGGLISKQETRQENGIPYFKDIPYAGALFRFRTHTIQRREIIIIMTPHIIRSELDQARVLAEEAGPTKHCWPDVLSSHKHGGEVIGPATQGARPVPVNPNAMQQPYNFGPAYFGDPIPMSGAQPSAPQPNPQPTVPGMPMQPGTPQPAPTAFPGIQPPNGPQPGAMSPGTVLPQVPVAPVGQPVGMNSPAGLIPVSGTQPPYAPTPVPAPVTPVAAPAMPSPPAMPASVPPAGSTQPLYTIHPAVAPRANQPIVSSTAQPLPVGTVLTGAGNRPFVMVGSQPQQPAVSKNAPPPADQKPNVKEGNPWAVDPR